jgi:hypothetical protein
LYENKVLKRHSITLKDINDSVPNINKLSGNAQSRAISEHTASIMSTLTDMINSKMKPRTQHSKRLSGNPKSKRS